jgi:hypothetical protein
MTNEYELDLTPLDAEAAAAEEKLQSFFWHRKYDSISPKDWCAFLRFYRCLRIRIPYADPGSPELDGNRGSGMFYGASRDEARSILRDWASALAWACYLASK